MNVFTQQAPLLLRSMALLAFSFTLAWLGNVPVTYIGGAAALLL